MTFLEAAIEVLRTERDPLHFSEITRRAVERKLLSHVGRDPEAAMQTCLNSAVRNSTYGGLLVRGRPGHYGLRPGTPLPELPPPPSSRSRTMPAVVSEKVNNIGHSGRKSSTPSKVSAAPDDDDDGVGGGDQGDDGEAGGGDDEGPRRKKRGKKAGRKRGSRGRSRAAKAAVADEPEVSETAPDVDAEEAEAEEMPEGEAADAEVEPEAEDVEASDEGDELEPAEADDLDSDDDEAEGALAHLPPPNLDPNRVRFRGPAGSGLEDDTDITLVMANAMSRLVEERPELREELEAMQRPPPPTPEIVEVRPRRREERAPRWAADAERRGEPEEERGGRRRRRRRRRSRRVEWQDGATAKAGARSEELLDKVAAILADAGSRSLHVRQIAENLASQNVLGGEISEIERAVTAALLVDVHRRGEGSRFALRGDARYQLRGARLPEKAAAAEQAARRAVIALEGETEKQLVLWLQTLGARALESIVRVWLDREEFSLIATLPPSRGLAKLITEDPEDDDGRTLVLIVPRKTALEPKLWDGEAERNNCGATLVFAMGEGESGVGRHHEDLGADTRVIGAVELGRWLLRNGVGVRTVRFEVPVLDADLIESVAGLDT